MLRHSPKDLSEVHMQFSIRFWNVSHDKDTTIWCQLTFEAILAVFHGHLVWHLGGIVNEDCVMDIRHMFPIRYTGPLNSKHTSSVSAWSTTQPYSLNVTPG